MTDRSRGVLITGPLAPHKDGFIADLLGQGYTPLTVARLLQLMAHLSRWLAGSGRQPADLTTRRLDNFLRHRRELGYTWRPTMHGLEAVLNYLRRLGIMPAEEQLTPERTALDVVLEHYGKFLADERSLSPCGIRQYQKVARCFLLASLGAGEVILSRLRTADVSSFILTEARRSSVGYAKFKVTALRSFLRYLHVQGEIPGDLSGAVPPVAGWRLTGLPKALTPVQARRLLLAFDRHTRTGRRGYAAVVLMLRLGLRAKEVASLTLDDCDWSRGELLIHGKQGRQDVLPIPEDVGQAIVSYLRFGRPDSTLRGLFLSEHAPRRNMTRSMVTKLVRAAGDRCGIQTSGHRGLASDGATGT